MLTLVSVSLMCLHGRQALSAERERAGNGQGRLGEGTRARMRGTTLGAFPLKKRPARPRQS